MSYKDHGTRSRKLSAENVSLKAINGELLEACKVLLDCLNRPYSEMDDEACRNILREAINKAESR